VVVLATCMVVVLVLDVVNTVEGLAHKVRLVQAKMPVVLYMVAAAGAQAEVRTTEVGQVVNGATMAVAAGEHTEKQVQPPVLALMVAIIRSDVEMVVVAVDVRLAPKLAARVVQEVFPVEVEVGAVPLIPGLVEHQGQAVMGKLGYGRIR